MIGNHSETLTFDVTPLGGHNIILGLPWLQQHDPLIHWSTKKVTFACNYCTNHCLTQLASMFLKQHLLVQSFLVIGEVPDPKTDTMTTEEIDICTIVSPSTLTLMEGAMPNYYHQEIPCFNGKKVVMTLPNLHEHNNLAIDLNPGKPFPKLSQPHHMNQEECVACQKVLNEMLKARQAEPANASCQSLISLHPT